MVARFPKRSKQNARLSAGTMALAVGAAAAAKAALSARPWGVLR